MKSKIEIKHRFSGSVLFASESETLHEAVMAAIKSGANLSNAYLSGANLSGANLSRANLSGANLSNAYLSNAYLSRSQPVRSQPVGSQPVRSQPVGSQPVRSQKRGLGYCSDTAYSDRRPFCGLEEMPGRGAGEAWYTVIC